jgi:sugar transferase EpsL
MLKRLIDLIISLVSIVLLSPFLLFVIITIYIKMGRPIFFTQRRPGYKGKIFLLIKFRTMINNDTVKAASINDHSRITPLGHFLRNTSIDELPELVNVLKGEMSLVGPRPLLEEYMPLYNEEQSKRHLVRPGITGWSQVNGRNKISWEEKFKLDLWYVNNHSLLLDFKILFKSIYLVFMKKNINSSKDEIMPKFNGTKCE